MPRSAHHALDLSGLRGCVQRRTKRCKLLPATQTMTYFKLKTSTIAMAAALFAAAPLMASADPLKISTYAEFTDTRPGNITVTPQGRVIITQQPLDGPALRVVEVKKDGSKVPFPNLDWADGPDIGKVGIASTIGIKSDSKGVIWILDMGSKTAPAQLVAWDSVANKLHKVIAIPTDVIRPISFLQDFALDEKRGQIYIADMTFTAPASATQPAFIVIDIATGKARRVLESNAALMPVDHHVTIKGALMGFKGEDGKSNAWKLGLNAISIDPTFNFVYFGTINGSDVFRIPAAALADSSKDDAALAKDIQRYANKRPNDGFIVDGKGRVITGDIEASAIGIATPQGYKVIAQDDVRLAWPDGFAFAPDGTLFVTANQLNTHPALNQGKDDSTKRYFILTLKP